MTDAAYEVFTMALQERYLEGLLLAQKGLDRITITRALERVLVSLLPLLSPKVIVEVGAHEAAFSKAAKQTLPAARVIAMEANAFVFDRFKDDLTSRGVEFLNQAAADSDGRLQFLVPENKEHGEITSMGSLLSTTLTSKANAIEVDAVRLDTLIGEGGLPNILWIDVEGAAGQVLKGASCALKSCVALYAELEPSDRAWPGQTIDVAVIELLTSLGLVPVLRDVQRKGWQYNMLFLRREVLVRAEVKLEIDRYFDSLVGR